MRISFGGRRGKWSLLIDDLVRLSLTTETKRGCVVANDDDDGIDGEANMIA